MLPDKIREYLSFTRRERIGIGVLIFILIPLLIIPELFRKKNLTINLEETRKYEEAIASLNKKMIADSSEATESQSIKLSERFSSFDPNQLDKAGWKSFGLGNRVIETIDHYRKKGGIFRNPGDLRKIYGLSEEKIRIMIPYVRIQNEKQAEIFNYKKYKQAFIHDEIPQNKQKEKKFFVEPLLDINSADSGDFLNLHGIGPKLAGRIVHFREKLGGFYSIDQVGETFGLADSVFRSIKSNLLIGNHAIDSLKKIDVNHCDFRELSQHPYIRYSIAKVLIEFRNQHGPFVNLQDLEKLHGLNKELLDRIIPYLKI
jgi:DNA uptake protein ComE-like DNA-binding protein